MTQGTLTIDASPIEGLVDEPLSIVVSGLEPGAQVDISAIAHFPTASDWAAGGEWSVSATYEADDRGVVDLGRQQPVSGDYRVADANALIWALRPVTTDPASRRLTTGLEPWDLVVRATSGNLSAETTIHRLAIAPEVRREEILADGLAIHLFLPAGERPFPTVLVLAGSGGGYPDRQAALLASHGLAAVSLAYFGVDGLPSDLRDIPLEYFEQALAWIADHPDLDERHLAVSGTSRGGELALLLASRYPAIRSVVAWVPSGYVWGAVSASDEADDGRSFASWTYGGEPIPYAGRVRNDDAAPDDRGIVNLTPAFHKYLADPQRAAAARIEIERINGPVLLISGGADALWPSKWFSDRIVEEARSRGFDFAVEHLTYDSAGHGIGSGIAPTTITESLHPVRQVVIGFGGTPEGLAAATQDAWPRALEFLKQTTVPAAR